MAKLNVEIRENGDVKYTLEFAGRTFDMTMIRNEWGAESDKPSLDDQVEKELGDVLIGILGEEDAEEVLGLICELDSFATIGTVDDNIVALTEYEAQLKEGAEP